MSSSHGTERDLTEQSKKLHIMAQRLEEAAEILRSLREDSDVADRYKLNLAHAKSWMDRSG